MPRRSETLGETSVSKHELHKPAGRDGLFDRSGAIVIEMKPVDNLYEMARILDGVPVLGIMPNSPSARAGLAFGDILIECNGMRTRILDDYLEARKLDKRTMHLRVFRAGQELEMTLDLARAPLDPSSILKFIEDNDGLRYIVPTSQGKSEEGSSCN